MSTPSAEDDDDRTVIRPLPAAPPPMTTVMPPAAAAPAAATAGGTIDDDATVMPSAPRAPRPAPVEHDDDGSTLPVGTRLGEFELTGVVGIGGFGIVYLAQDRSLGRRVAVKEYMPSALASRRGGTQVSVKSERHRETFDAGLKSFVNEARLLAQFDHPSLVKVYRFWEANGTAYMVMPFYEGTTLKDRLRELGAPPDEAWLRAILGPLTEALEVLHAEQCYHRDIAPDNVILLAGSGRPLLLDFGAARRVIGDMTQALTVILKPGYAPLEQYAEVPNMKQGPWTDVYALAAVVYFAITGKTPPVSVGRMMGDSYVPLATSHAGRYGDDFLRAVDHALKVTPDERTPSIAALRAEMALDAPAAPETQRVLAAPPAPAAAPVAPAKAAAAAAASPPSRMPLFAGIGAALLAVAGVGAYLALSPGKPAPVVAARTASPPPAPSPVSAPAPAAQAAPSPAPTAVTVGQPVPPIRPAPFSIGAEFERVVQAQSPGFDVNVAMPKPRLRIGRDALSFKVTSSREGHVTVLVDGPDGSLTQLLPNATVKTLRIGAGQTLTLPPPSFPLNTSEPAGPENFLVVVSARPRSWAELGGTVQDGMRVWPRADALAPAAQAAAAAGKPPVLAGEVRDCQGAGCGEYGAARATVEVVR